MIAAAACPEPASRVERPEAKPRTNDFDAGEDSRILLGENGFVRSLGLRWFGCVDGAVGARGRPALSRCSGGSRPAT